MTIDEMGKKYLKLHNRYLDMIEECIEYKNENEKLKESIITLGDMCKDQRIKLSDKQKQIDLYKSREVRLLNKVK